MALQLQHWKFTVEQFEQMGAAGILDEDDRVELVDGEIVEMSPIGAPHLHCVNRLTRLLVLAAGDRAVVQVQNPVRIGEYQEFLPDLSLLRPLPPDTPEDVPAAPDVLLVIEVADTTMRHDRGVKLPRYARAGVPEVWIVDLQRGHLLVYREPGDDGYRRTQTVRRGASVAPLSLPDQPIDVDAILG